MQSPSCRRGLERGSPQIATSELSGHADIALFELVSVCGPETLEAGKIFMRHGSDKPIFMLRDVFERPSGGPRWVRSKHSDEADVLVVGDLEVFTLIAHPLENFGDTFGPCVPGIHKIFY